MKKLLCISAAVALLVAMSGTLQAFPSFAITNGNSCSSGCHETGSDGPLRPGALEVLGEGLLDLDADRNDGKTRGEIQFFTTTPGGTIDLTMNVLDGADDYAVQIKRFDKDGILGPGGDSLAGYSPDATWFAQGSLPTTYFTSIDGFSGTEWTGGPDPYSFQLTLDPNTPLNTYDLEYAVAGHFHNDLDEGRFYMDEHFYLRVIPEPSSLALMVAGLVGVGLATWYRRKG